MSLSKNITLQYISGNVKCYVRFLVALFAIVLRLEERAPFLVGISGDSASVSSVMPD